MKCVFLWTLLCLTAITSSLHLLDLPPVNCSQQGLACRVQVGNCLDEGLLVPRIRAPGSSPVANYNIRTKKDKSGQYAPVLNLTWHQLPDGNIYILNGTEVRVVETATNDSGCIRYIFLNKPQWIKNPKDEMWSFSLDRIVVKPGFEYQLFLTNLPKPDIGSYTKNIKVTVPENIWKPKLIWTVDNIKKSSLLITVDFQSKTFFKQYRVSLHISGLHAEPSHTVLQDNQTSLRVNFILESRQITDCSLYLVIRPLSVQCIYNCLEYKEKVDICPYLPEAPIDFVLVILVPLLVILAVLVCCAASLRHKCFHKAFHSHSKISSFKTFASHHQSRLLVDTPSLHSSTSATHEPEWKAVHEPRRVLIIYSLDHLLYKEIILKFCAFLRAKCGTDVTLDLLDSAWLSTIGKIQWLDMQRQQICRSSDKVLILCSAGVYAKWRAMCGEDRVRLKEDEYSPMGDMLTPALSLFILDFVHASSYHKYIVAYFDDVCSENDVPAPFNTVVKYKLMKHFEELYFRILDVEKHEVGQIKSIEGIRENDYFSCPSGKALRDAIKAFHSYQLKNPQWFEMELLDSDDEEEAASAQPIFPTDPFPSSVTECCQWTEEHEAHSRVNLIQCQNENILRASTEETGVMLHQRSLTVTADVQYSLVTNNSRTIDVKENPTTEPAAQHTVFSAPL